MSKWFDMILFEGKLEEYRIIKPYWTKRFKNYFGEYYDFSVDPPVPVWNQIKKDVVFKNGYRKDARQFTAECSISEGTGREEWGAVPGEKYYILTIHRIFDTKNCSLLKYLKQENNMTEELMRFNELLEGISITDELPDNIL